MKKSYVIKNKTSDFYIKTLGSIIYYISEIQDANLFQTKEEAESFLNKHLTSEFTISST
jgi:hypothetical protein